MKRSRILLSALVVCATALTLIAVRAQATSANNACGPGPFHWYCTCRQIGCGSGRQLCAQGAGFTCFQDGLR